MLAHNERGFSQLVREDKRVAGTAERPRFVLKFSVFQAMVFHFKSPAQSH